MDNNGFNLTAVSSVKVDNGSGALEPEASEGFVCTPYTEELTRRALTYLEAGYPIHFAGPAGTGKTTLAFHVAASLGRPVILIHGDDEFGSSDLVGKDIGYRKSKLIDNFIHSVLRTEENLSTVWMDNRLTAACRNGYTLIYDEFNRSRPETNNALLSVLEERVLSVPGLGQSESGYLEVHPNFRAILTSNPEEYAGVHKTQDALTDRLITIQLDHCDRDSEIKIVAARSGIGREDAERVVDLVRECRKLGVNNHRPTIRASIALGVILTRRRMHARREEPLFLEVCRDVLGADSAKVTREGEPLMRSKIEELVRKVCSRGGKRARRNARRNT